MSIVVEEQVENLEESFDSIEDYIEEPVEETAQYEPEPEGSTIPDKFKDKNLEEVIHSYQELEKEFGRKNNEIGELRKLTDQILDLQLQQGNKSQEPEKKEVDFDSLLENPSGVVNDLLAENPKIKALEEQLAQAKRANEEKAFAEKHPNYMDKAQSPEFLAFVQASPIRQKMFMEANNNYDYAMADELFTLYDAISGGQSAQVAEQNKEKRNKDLKKASVEKGSTGASSKKIYRRSDLLKLRMTDPDKYAAMEPEIILAYQEKRVR